MISETLKNEILLLFQDYFLTETKTKSNNTFRENAGIYNRVSIFNSKNR